MMTLLVIACTAFMEKIDATTLAIALPKIARDFGESPIALKLVITSYLVSIAMFLPISGWLADRLGTRTILHLSIAVFIFGSLLCGISCNLLELVCARFLQGIGSAMMIPICHLTMLKSFEKGDIVRACNIIAIPTLLGLMLGPLLGGVITTHWHWRWIFSINVPIGMLSIILSTRYLPNIVTEHRSALDMKGFMILSAGLSTLMFGLSTLGRHLIPPSIPLASSTFGAVLLFAYVIHARKALHPLLHLELFTIPTFRAGIIGGTLYRLGVGSLPFLLTLMLQLGFGMSPLLSGILICTSMISGIFMNIISLNILHRFGFRIVLLINAAIASAFVFAYSLLTAQTPYELILCILLIEGCCRALQLTSLNAISYADIPPAHKSQATCIANVAQQIAVAVSIIIGAAALQASSTLQGRTDLDATDFPWAFLIVGLVSASSAISLMKLSHNAGDELARRI